VLDADGEDVVQPWEEREEVVEAGLDDTTAPGLAGDSGSPDRPGREAGARWPEDEDMSPAPGREPPD